MASAKVDRLIRAYALIDQTPPRGLTEAKVVRLQAAMADVKAQLTSDEQVAYGAALQAYWREKHERSWR